MARKLFPSLEDETPEVLDVVDTNEEIIEQQEDNTEVADIVADIREDLDTLEASIDAGEDAETTQEIVADAVEKDEPLDAASATLVQESINVLFARTGGKAKRVVASLESYSTGARSDRMYATKLTLESFSEELKKYWGKVKDFFAKMWVGVVNFFENIFIKKAALLSRIGKLAERAAKAEDVKEGTKISVPKAYAGVAALKTFVAEGKTVMDGLVTSGKAVEDAIKSAKAAKETLSGSKTQADLEAFTSAITAIDEAAKAVVGAAKLEGESASKEETTIGKTDLATIKEASATLKVIADIYASAGAKEAEVAEGEKADKAEEAKMEEEIKAEGVASEEDKAGKAGIMGRVKAWWSFKRASTKATTAIESAMYNTVSGRFTAVAKYVGATK